MAVNVKLVTEAGIEPRRPRIITALGKQKSGKTLFLRYFVERGASTRLRPLKLIDADPHNSTLAGHFPDAVSPGSSALEDRRFFLEQSIREQRSAKEPYDALWDVGGGDLLMAKLARDVHFTETVEKAGFDLIAFYLLSPSLSDLEYFQKLDDAGFRPKRLGLVFNAGLIQGDRAPASAFAAMLKAPLIAKLIKDGAETLFLPALASDCVEAIEASGATTFRDAIPKLGDMWHEMRLETWLNQATEKQIAKPLLELGWLV